MSKPDKKIGRPAKGVAARTISVGLKVSAEEHELISQACERVQRKMSEWCRLRLIAQARAELGLDDELKIQD